MERGTPPSLRRCPIFPFAPAPNDRRGFFCSPTLPAADIVGATGLKEVLIRCPTTGQRVSTELGLESVVFENTARCAFHHAMPIVRAIPLVAPLGCLDRRRREWRDSLELRNLTIIHDDRRLPDLPSTLSRKEAHISRIDGHRRYRCGRLIHDAAIGKATVLRRDRKAEKVHGCYLQLGYLFFGLVTALTVVTCHP